MLRPKIPVEWRAAIAVLALMAYGAATAGVTGRQTANTRPARVPTGQSSDAQQRTSCWQYAKAPWGGLSSGLPTSPSQLLNHSGVERRFRRAASRTLSAARGQKRRLAGWHFTLLRARFVSTGNTVLSTVRSLKYPCATEVTRGSTQERLSTASQPSSTGSTWNGPVEN